MLARRLSQREFVVEFSELLVERGVSLRSVARDAGVDPTFLSRAVRGVNGKSPSVELIGRVSVALGLPEDYWPEVRLAVVVRALESDSVLREDLYRRVTRGL